MTLGVAGIGGTGTSGVSGEFKITGTAPASSSTLAGLNVGTLFGVLGVTGGATTHATSAGGIGSLVSILAGNGGAGNTSGAGGAGGTITETTGTGGTAGTTGAGGAGGAFTLSTGAGAIGGTTSGTGGAGGAFGLTAGAGGAQTVSGNGGAGGSITLTGGAGGNGATTGGNGGNIILTPGAVGTGGTPTAGAVQITAGTLQMLTAPTVTTPGTGFYLLGTEGTEPGSIASGTSGFVMDSTSHCPVVWENATNVGCPATLQGKTTAGLKVPIILAVLDQTGVSTANSGSAQNILASTPVAGHYRVHVYVDQSAGCATLGSGALTVITGWTDATHARVSATQTLTVATADTGTGDWVQIVQDLWSANASAITVTDTYTACTTGTWTYDQHAYVEELE